MNKSTLKNKLLVIGKRKDDICYKLIDNKESEDNEKDLNTRYIMTVMIEKNRECERRIRDLEQGQKELIVENREMKEQIKQLQTDFNDLNTRQEQTEEFQRDLQEYYKLKNNNKRLFSGLR
jgi:hypothetical protein